MRPSRNETPIVPGLPILDELGDALTRRLNRQERIRRRRGIAIGALAGVIVLLATTVALIGSAPQRAQAVEIAAGRVNDVGWRLIFTESGSLPCLKLSARDGTTGDRLCARSAQPFDAFVARTKVDGQAFVYGFVDADTSAVRFDASGRITGLVPSTPDPLRREGAYRREVKTISLAASLRETRALSAKARAFVAPIPGGKRRTVTIVPAEPGNTSLVVWVQ